MKSSEEEWQCEGLSSASNGNESVQHSRAIRLGHEDGEGEEEEEAWHSKQQLKLQQQRRRRQRRAFT